MIGKILQYLVKAIKIIFIFLFIIIFLPLFILLILFCYVFLNLKNISKSISREEVFKPPSKEKIIYNAYYNGGADFYIFYYDKALNLDKFKLIKKSNQNYIKEIVFDYYNSLTNNEKVLFSIHIKKDNLNKIGNYYLYNKKDNILLIAIENKIYYFRKQK